MSGLRLFVGFVITCVVVVAVVGLYLAGSPGQEREKRLDQRRLSDLQTMARAVESFYLRHGELPAEPEQLLAGDLAELPLDPTSGDEYDYRVTGPASYELCAEFAAAGPDYATAPREPVALGLHKSADFWGHPAGYHCFDRNAAADQARQICGAGVPCPAGFQCAVLPDSSQPICLAEDDLCAAAGCQDCLIMESYPLQIRCPDEGNEEPPAAEPVP